MDLERMSVTPAHSRTARTGPPAITPVPGAAGRSMTVPAESWPTTGWVTVPRMRGTVNMCFLGSHYLVYKEFDADGTARTGIRRIEGEDRVAEVARMLSGSELTSAAVENARELLAKAGN